ncbi:MAG: hypothetical protein IPI23_14330 [Bacteroidetes bacterium]|nr:hypothetical protein [Bacteroidota bacterium]
MGESGLQHGMTQEHLKEIADFKRRMMLSESSCRSAIGISYERRTLEKMRFPKESDRIEIPGSSDKRHSTSNRFLTSINIIISQLVLKSRVARKHSHKEKDNVAEILVDNKFVIEDMIRIDLIRI